MIDVASVAERLLHGVLPGGTTQRLLDAFTGSGDSARRWIVFFVALHDLGKATPAFQRKWGPAVRPLERLGLDLAPPRTARDHGTIGVTLAGRALGSLGLDPLLAHRTARAVAAHHGSFATDAQADGRTASSAELGRTAAWSMSREALVARLGALLGVADLEPPRLAREDDWGFFSALAGLTSLADWVGSMAEVFTYEPPSDALDDYASRARERADRALDLVGFRRASTVAEGSFEAVFGFPPRPLQDATAALLAEVDAPFCAVVEAPMGEGKTEAALYVAHALGARGRHDGAYLGLPTQATANQMFERLSTFLERTRPGERVNLQLIHGEAVFDARVHALLRAVYAEGGGLVCESWFLAKKRALLAPFGAGTIDQALLSVMRTRHAFVRQLGLAAKTVVLDEVHAYDTYTSTLLDRLVAWLGALGSTVVILSATLPAARRRALLEAYAGRELVPAGPTPAYPRLSWATATASGATAIATGRPATRVRLDWAEDDDDRCVQEVLQQAARGGCVAVLRNTVRRAQTTFAKLLRARREGSLPDGTELLLLHARFPAEDRARLERRLVGTLGRGGARPARMIVVGTQVLEQSLDVDFDLMITDLAPIDLLLQRAGRLHRHERRLRPPGTGSPTLRIAVPPGDPSTCDLRSMGAVYEPYVLRRSLLLLRDRREVSLPSEIETLVESVYGADPEALAGPLRSERERFEATRTEQERSAKDRVWPSPRVRDDPFADLHAWFEEDDPDVARVLRAETRLGDESVEVVCLFGTEERAYLDAGRTAPIDLRAEPATDVVRSLARRTVRVGARGLVPALRALPPPPSWRDVATLARRRPLFFDGAPLRVGDFALELDSELGLLIDRDARATGGGDAVLADA
jgi:CRISPR-associated endonuclease/helicase Cas3